jgi:hypothetical protein
MLHARRIHALIAPVRIPYPVPRFFPVETHAPDTIA